MDKQTKDYQDLIILLIKKCYNSRKIISSSIAQSNIENLINKRRKGKQHMKWSRSGIHSGESYYLCK